MACCSQPGGPVLGFDHAETCFQQTPDSQAHVDVIVDDQCHGRFRERRAARFNGSGRDGHRFGSTLFDGDSRQAQSETTAESGPAVDSDTASMALDNLTHQCQTDAGTLRHMFGLGLEESIEDMRQRMRSNALAIVANADGNLLWIHRQRHRNRAAAGCVLGGIAHQVAQRTFQLQRITSQIQRRKIRQVQFKLVAESVGQRLPIEPLALNEADQIDVLAIHWQLTLLKSIDVEQLHDQIKYSSGIAIGQFQQLAGAITEAQARIAHQVIQWPQHQREGCAEFVADIGEEACLQAIHLGQTFGLLGQLHIGQLQCLGATLHDRFQFALAHQHLALPTACAEPGGRPQGQQCQQDVGRVGRVAAPPRRQYSNGASRHAGDSPEAVLGFDFKGEITVRQIGIDPATSFSACPVRPVVVIADQPRSIFDRLRAMHGRQGKI